mmetsp:Transcript_1614/g.2138  ORF Transcript_1614/g.2138 Transcript_1614/m.2138 type:complete len:450 (+) Transcript_1614:273-1622(+)
MNIPEDQINRLFHKLSTLPTNTNTDINASTDTDTATEDSIALLPDEINDAIKAVINARKNFIKVVDRFVHNVDDTSKEEIVHDIIEICPQILSSRNKHGLLPIHTACFRDSNSIFVPMFAKAGLKHEVSGIHGRGGLLAETSKGNNTLELLAGSTDACYENDKCLVETMKALMNASPPLLQKEELYHQGYLLKALANERVAMTKFLIGFDKMKLYEDVLSNTYTKNSSEVKGTGTWPIHVVTALGEQTQDSKANYELFKYLLQTGMKNRSLITDRGHDDYMGGLFAIDSRTNISTFELAMKSFGEAKTWNCITSCIPPSSTDHCILQRAIALPVKYLGGFMSRYPKSFFKRDDNGSLPIHAALKEGVEWSTELISIINANMNALQSHDPCYNMHPFVLAAAGPKCDLTAIYYMLSLHPEHITHGIRKSNSDACLSVTSSLSSEETKVDS